MSYEANAVKRWDRAAALVVVAGLVAGFAWFNWALDDQTRTVNGFVRLPPRSDIPLEIESPGTYTIWAGAGCNGLCDPPPAAEMYETMILGFHRDGSVVRPEPFPGEQSYRLNSTQHGYAAWVVHFDEPGTYVLERRNLGSGSATLLLGEGEGMPTRITPVLVTIGVLTVGIAGALLVIGRVRRKRALDAMVARIHGDR
ncbi:hypothetical protein [Actinomarinicola tropica]|uniref:Uncharacterized protein n=1 Tax=Actinomarinicola tropica TaxID=2789776 RepID=A0A5Q2RNW0_9ACTN|nr:hypothetical protein [Actinomarinicola tropica]QGG94885.1 hypothetical protein GH723_07055 [Actinomarinicola tropica]